MAVSLSDPAVTAMDQKLAALIPHDLSPMLDGFALGVVDRRRARVSFATNSPSLIVRDDVLVLTRHGFTSYLAAFVDRPVRDAGDRQGLAFVGVGSSGIGLGQFG